VSLYLPSKRKSRKRDDSAQIRCKANVKLRPNFTSKTGFYRAKYELDFLRNMPIISHKPIAGMSVAVPEK
jgi:hypothetical protein